MTRSDKPAFPVYADTNGYIEAHGMTLREYYAGQALVGILSGGLACNSLNESAKYAVRLADLIIAELEKPR